MGKSIEVFDPAKARILEFSGGKKEFDYKFADKERIEYNKMLGWEVVNIKEDGITPGPLLKNAGQPGDNTLQSKYNILMHRPKEIGEKVRESKVKRHLERLRDTAWQSADRPPIRHLSRKDRDNLKRVVETVLEKLER